MADHPHVLAGSRACATREMDPNELRRLLRTRPKTTVPLPIPEAPAEDTWADVTSVAAPDAATLAALAEGSDVAAVVVPAATDKIPSLAPAAPSRWPLRAALMIGLAFAILATQL